MEQHKAQRAAQPLKEGQTPQGDEREQSVFNAGGLYGMYIGMCMCLFTALVFALFGHVLVPMVLIVLAAIPSLVMFKYAEKRGVDAFAVLARSRSRAAGAGNAASLAILLVIAAAMFYTTWTGTGLLEFQVGQTWASRFGSAANGVAIGAGLGAVLGFLGAVWAVRNRHKQQQDELTAPDEE